MIRLTKLTTCWSKFVFIFVLVVGLVPYPCLSVENPDKKLIEHLLNDYNKDIRPYVSDPPGGTIHVKLGMHLMQSTEVNAKTQVLESHIWMQFKWVDEQLKWEPKDFDNLTDIRLPGDQIWMPDLELFNSADDLTQLLVSGVKYSAVVKHTGEVSIIEPKTMRSLCEMNLFFYRFDTQTCELKIGSWTHHGSHIDLNASDAVDLDKFAKSGEYEILDTKMIKTVNQYACCEEAYVDITATLVIRWRNLFYILDTVIPFILMSFLMVMTFQLRVDRNLGLRVVAGTTAFLMFCTYFWYETGFVSNKPGPVPLIVLYMTFMMVLAMLTVFGTLFVWKLGQVGPNALLLPKCVTCVMSSRVGSYTVKDDRRDNIPLSDYGFMDTANLQETGSVSSLVLVDRDKERGATASSSGSQYQQRSQRMESCQPTYLNAGLKMDRILYRVIGSVVLVLNTCITLVAIFK